MNTDQILELIANGENSRVEFKRDDCHPDDIGKEMSALLNLEGGVIMLGVEDDGQVSGLTRSRAEAEQWIMNIASNNLQPPALPIWSVITVDEDKEIGVVECQAGSLAKPHKARRGRAWVTYMRAGSQSREATRDEEARLYQAAGLVRYELKAVPGMEHDSLDMRRLENYFRDVLRRSAPGQGELSEWQQLLHNSDLLATAGNSTCATVASLLLFGLNPNRRLPQAGVTAAAFPNSAKDYSMVDEERIRGPLTPVISESGELVDKGVIDRTVDFVSRNMGSIAWLDGARRRTKPALPLDAVREAVVNAVAHRDYAREGTDIEVSLYVDRLEVISPGRLPNGVTVEKMREGVVRVARNELVKEILRDYRYIEHQGMGVRSRIIESMRRHNATEAELVEEDDRFIVRLWKNSA